MTMQRLRGWLTAPALLALVVALGWLGTRYHARFDWTAGERRSLSKASIGVLDRLGARLVLTAYASKDRVLRGRISALVERYTTHKPDIVLRFVDPRSVPDEMRRLGVNADGEMRVEYAGRTERLAEPTEQALTSALNRLARSGDRWIVFLSGHGERDLLGKANHDLGEWGSRLRERGYTLGPLELASAGAIPANTAVLVVAGPQVDLLPGEAAIVEHFVSAGGNLLWLAEPGPLRGLAALGGALGVTFSRGTIIDPETAELGIDHPGIVVATHYGTGAITTNFTLVTLFAQAVALSSHPVHGWTPAVIVRSSDRAWSARGPTTAGATRARDMESAGPFSIGVSLERPAPDDAARGAALQRVVVMGDGDFLSNAYLGNGGNLDLGLNIINWLSHDDALMDIPARTAPDVTLSLGRRAGLVMGLGNLFVIPGVLFLTGLWLWWRRRRR